ncbi:hypothetical protein KXR53_03590 [Inquilinus limosus]|uniref:hypothetical protein n=1 Tax=Inquilinus limosus TaxID=171674 RepID=UPI003F16BB34
MSAPQGQKRFSRRLTFVKFHERSRPTLIDQQSEGLELCVTHLVVAPQHVEPALEHRAEARYCPLSTKPRARAS